MILFSVISGDPQPVRTDKSVMYVLLTGNKHTALCDVCAAESMLGARWKCRECDDYDLCDECYHSDMHDLTHRFTRFDLKASRGSVNLL